MELCSIASGSSGNCIYVGTEDTHLLVDAGISKKRIEEGLTEIDIDPKSISGILITHEHSDHISGLGVMARRYHMPIYATEGTVRRLLQGSSLGKLDPGLFRYVEPEKPFSVGDIEVKPFSIPHDAADPVSYTFSSGGKKIGVATDLGVFTEAIVENLRGVQALLLEANHDVHMLEAGTYPYALKRRILGDRGHLSNENSGVLLAKIWNEGLRYIFLGHLSKENNFPDLAYESVRVELLKEHAGFEQFSKLLVAPRSQAGEPAFI